MTVSNKTRAAMAFFYFLTRKNRSQEDDMYVINLEETFGADYLETLIDSFSREEMLRLEIINEQGDITKKGAVWCAYFGTKMFNSLNIESTGIKDSIDTKKTSDLELVIYNCLRALAFRAEANVPQKSEEAENAFLGIQKWLENCTVDLIAQEY